jgi:hypothetical protein
MTGVLVDELWFDAAPGLNSGRFELVSDIPPGAAFPGSVGFMSPISIPDLEFSD